MEFLQLVKSWDQEKTQLFLMEITITPNCQHLCMHLDSGIRDSLWTLRIREKASQQDAITFGFFTNSIPIFQLQAMLFGLYNQSNVIILMH